MGLWFCSQALRCRLLLMSLESLCSVLCCCRCSLSGRYCRSCGGRYGGCRSRWHAGWCVSGFCPGCCYGCRRFRCWWCSGGCRQLSSLCPRNGLCHWLVGVLGVFGYGGLCRWWLVTCRWPCCVGGPRYVVCHLIRICWSSHLCVDGTGCCLCGEDCHGYGSNCYHCGSFCCTDLVRHVLLWRDVVMVNVVSRYVLCVRFTVFYVSRPP